MNFELIGYLGFSDMKRVYSKGVVYTADDSEREEILSQKTETGSPVFREVKDADQNVEEEGKPVAKTSRHLPPNAKKTIQIGKKAVETPKSDVKTEKTEEEKPSSDSPESSEPDAVI